MLNRTPSESAALCPDRHLEQHLCVGLPYRVRQATVMHVTKPVHGPYQAVHVHDSCYIRYVTFLAALEGLRS